MGKHQDEPPPVSNGFISHDGQPYYIGVTAYPIAVAAARLRVANLPLPGLALPGPALPGANESGTGSDGR